MTLSLTCLHAILTNGKNMFCIKVTTVWFHLWCVICSLNNHNTVRESTIIFMSLQGKQVKQGRIIYKNLMHQTIENKCDFPGKQKFQPTNSRNFVYSRVFQSILHQILCMHCIPKKGKRKKKSMMEEHQGEQSLFNKVSFYET